MARTDLENWVYEEWLSLTDFTPHRAPQAEDLARARTLYAKTYVDSTWSVGIHAACKVATTTMFVEVWREEYEDAARTLRSLLTHPGYAQADPVEVEYAEHWMAAFEIRGGDIPGGTARLRRMLLNKPRTMAFRMVNGSLRIVLEAPLTVPDPLPAKLVAFTREFVGMYKGTRKILAECDDTRAGLLQLLENSFGKSPK